MIWMGCAKCRIIFQTLICCSLILICLSPKCPTYSSDNIAKGVWSNTQGYSNARVDELIAMAAVETDPAKRTALYAEFQEIIADEVPVYHTNTLPYHTVYNDNVGNPPLGIWGTSTPIDMTYLKK